MTTTVSLLLYAVLPWRRTRPLRWCWCPTSAVRAARAQPGAIDEATPQSLRLLVSWPEHERRSDHYAARIVIATPTALHQRSRHHDRAWRLVQAAACGYAAARPLAFYTDAVARISPTCWCAPSSRWARRRASISASGHDDRLHRRGRLSMFGAAGPAPRIYRRRRRPGRDDHAGGLARRSARLREAAELVMQICKQGYLVHIACTPLESSLLAPIVGEVAGILGPAASGAHALTSLSYPGLLSALRRIALFRPSGGASGAPAKRSANRSTVRGTA